MTNEAQINNNNKDIGDLTNIALVVNHGSLKTIPPYPLCAKREIFCGPNLPNKDTKERKYIKTKGYFFDIHDVISQLSEVDKKIDLVFAPLEVKNACFPKNLVDLNCPKIAFVFDTHHLLYPISTIINYVKREKFTHIFMYAQPAHLHFFYEAGFTQSAFYPHPTQKFNYRNNKKSAEVTYIGGRWKSSHLRRSRMVQFLEKNLPKNNIPFKVYSQLPRALWHTVLTRSKMIVLSSLNGQFTPQILSCLFAGALCFIDELSPQALLSTFFESGKHLVTWRNFDELLERINYYYYHPNEAEAIAQAGKFQVENNFVTTRNLAQAVFQFVFENKIDSRFLSINDKRCLIKRIESSEYFDARIRLYENIQDLHKIHESMNLISLTKDNLKPIADLADLTRLRITHVFNSRNSKREADEFYQSVRVESQINTILLPEIDGISVYDIGILEKQTTIADWELKMKIIGKLLKQNSLLWVFGELTSKEDYILEKNGFKRFVFVRNPVLLKIKEISRKICYAFWKRGKFPFPYLTIKPKMETVPNLSVFIRGWQGKLPFLF